VRGQLQQWLQSRRDDRPFFAYVHTMDPHDPYAPPEPYRSKFAPHLRTALDRLDTTLLDQAMAADPGLTAAAVSDDFEALYDGEIAYGDAQLGELVAELRRRHLYDNTLMVVLSDHGEEFLEHGTFGHGHSLYNELLRVPLVVKLPGPSRGGQVRAQPVQLIDFVPWLLGWLGLEASPKGDLLAVAGADGRRPLLALLRMDSNTMASVIYGNRHLVTPALLEPRGPHRLFDMRLDPGEHMNRAGDDPVTAGFLLGLLREQLTRLEEEPPAPTVAIDAELDARLRALGYGR